MARRRSFLMTPFFWHERNIGDTGQGSGPEGREEEEEGPSLQSPAARVAVHTSEAIATSPSVTNRQIFIASHLRYFNTVTLFLCSKNPPSMNQFPLFKIVAKSGKCEIRHRNQTLALFSSLTSFLALRLLLLLAPPLRQSFPDSKFVLCYLSLSLSLSRLSLLLLS